LAGADSRQSLAAESSFSSFWLNSESVPAWYSLMKLICRLAAASMTLRFSSNNSSPSSR
jgi:hypothetical protein